MPSKRMNKFSDETLRRWCREEASRRTGPAAQAADEKARIKLLKR